MAGSSGYDLFLSHAWRFHDDWSRFSDMLTRTAGFAWRNFSLPWHDPAMHANTEVGGRFIRDFLERQIIPAQAVVLLAGVHAIDSARVWVELEVDMARKRHIPVIGVPPFGELHVPEKVRELCDAVCGWSAAELVGAIQQLESRPAVSNT